MPVARVRTNHDYVYSCVNPLPRQYLEADYGKDWSFCSLCHKIITCHNHDNNNHKRDRCNIGLHILRLHVCGSTLHTLINYWYQHYSSIFIRLETNPFNAGTVFIRQDLTSTDSDV